MKLSLNLKYESERSRGWKEKGKGREKKVFRSRRHRHVIRLIWWIAKDDENFSSFFFLFCSSLETTLQFEFVVVPFYCDLYISFLFFRNNELSTSSLFFPDQTERSSSFFPLPSFFCRLKKYEGTSLWVREEKFEGTWKEQLFYLWKFKSSYNGKVYQGSKRVREGKKTRQRWSWKFGWVMKNEGKLSGKSLSEVFFLLSASVLDDVFCVCLTRLFRYYCWTMRLKFKFFVGT